MFSVIPNLFFFLRVGSGYGFTRGLDQPHPGSVTLKFYTLDISHQYMKYIYIYVSGFWDNASPGSWNSLFFDEN